MKEKLAKLIDVKSIVTLAMVIVLCVLMFIPTEVNAELRTLFCTSFGMIITYFFTKKKDGEANG